MHGFDVYYVGIGMIFTFSKWDTIVMITLIEHGTNEIVNNTDQFWEKNVEVSGRLDRGEFFDVIKKSLMGTND